VKTVSEFLDLLLALSVCFSIVWLLLNANRVAAYSRSVGKRAWRTYVVMLAQWVPDPIKTRIYAYHGKRALERTLQRQRRGRLG
jgi:hypothetical protein